MSVENQIRQYISSLPGQKGKDVEVLYQHLITLLPGVKLWYEDGKNAEGKVVSNPNIGFGSYTIRYADGRQKEFFQTGISANTAGISVYIMGLPDKTYLPQTFANTIGKATVTGYCIKFKTLADIDLHVLDEAIQNGMKMSADENPQLNNQRSK